MSGGTVQLGGNLRKNPMLFRLQNIQPGIEIA